MQRQVQHPPHLAHVAQRHAGVEVVGHRPGPDRRDAARERAVGGAQRGLAAADPGAAVRVGEVGVAADRVAPHDSVAERDRAVEARLLAAQVGQPEHGQRPGSQRQAGPAQRGHRQARRRDQERAARVLGHDSPAAQRAVGRHDAQVLALDRDRPRHPVHRHPADLRAVEGRAVALDHDPVLAQGDPDRPVHAAAGLLVAGERAQRLERAVVAPLQREQLAGVRAVAAEAPQRPVQRDVREPHVGERAAQPHAALAQGVVLVAQLAPAQASAQPELVGRAPAGQVAVEHPRDRRQARHDGSGHDRQPAHVGQPEAAQVDPAGALRDRPLQLEAAGQRRAVGPAEVERAERADPALIDRERSRPGGRAVGQQRAAGGELARAGRLGQQHGQVDRGVGRDRVGVGQRRARSARVHRQVDVGPARVEQDPPAHRNVGRAVARAHALHEDVAVEDVGHAVERGDRKAVVRDARRGEDVADQRLGQLRAEQRLDVDRPAQRQVRGEPEQAAQRGQVAVAAQAQPERRPVEQAVERPPAGERQAADRAAQGGRRQRVVGDRQAAAQVAQRALQGRDRELPAAQGQPAAQPVGEGQARLADPVGQHRDVVDHPVVEAHCLGVDQEAQRAAQRQLAGAHGVERQPALGVDRRADREREALDRRALAAPREQLAVDLERRARVGLDRGVDRDVLDLLVRQVGLQRRLVHQADRAVADPHGEVVRLGGLAGRRRGAARRAAGAVEGQRAVGVAGDGQHRRLDRDGGEAEAVRAAGEDVAQRVVDVDPLRVEHRVAVLDHVDVEQDRVRGPDPRRADPHVVAGRAREHRPQRAGEERVARQEQHGQERHDAGADQHRPSRRSQALHRPSRPLCHSRANVSRAG